MPFKKIKLFPFFSTLILFVLINIKANAQFFEGIRIGAGLGESIYFGTQSDNQISFNTYGYSEVNKGYNFQIYKSIKGKHEIGFRYLTTQLWSFKTDNRYAANTKLLEFALIYQNSLNKNIDLHSGIFTYNMVYGLGIINYSSTFYVVNNITGELRPFYSIGNGDKQVLATGEAIAARKTTLCGIVGFNIGCRLAKHISLYFENSFTLSTSNYITGNLSIQSNLPSNGYTHHSLSLFINIFGKPNPLSCPKIE